MVQNYSAYELNRRRPPASSRHHPALARASHTHRPGGAQHQPPETYNYVLDDGFYLHDPRTVGYNRLSDLFSGSSSEDSGLCFLPPSSSATLPVNIATNPDKHHQLLTPVKKAVQRPRRAAPLPPIPPTQEDQGIQYKVLCLSCASFFEFLCVV